MTRPSDRIPYLLDLIRTLWEYSPDQRFFQLLDNTQKKLGIDGRIDMFYYEDEEFIRALETLLTTPQEEVDKTTED